jgi:hypothetical protein
LKQSGKELPDFEVLSLSRRSQEDQPWNSPLPRRLKTL